MADNKFISRLKGELNSSSRIEIKDRKHYAPLDKLPDSTDSIYGVSADKNTSNVFATGSVVWAIESDGLVEKNNDYTADGEEYTGSFDCSDAGIWIDTSYTFPEDGDKLVGSAIASDSNFIVNLFGYDFLTKDALPVKMTVVVKIGNENVYSKQFTTDAKAGRFYKRFEMQLSDVAESITVAGKTMQVQVFCEENDVTATIFTGLSHVILQDYRIEHNDLYGRDAKNSHPIEAITGLREILDDHEERITQAEETLADHTERIETLEEKVEDKTTVILRRW